MFLKAGLEVEEMEVADLEVELADFRVSATSFDLELANFENELADLKLVSLEFADYSESVSSWSYSALSSLLPEL